MQELAAQAWNPWIACLVLGVGGLLLLATLVAPVRALPRALAALRGRTVTEAGGSPLLLPLAAATGMGGITGGVLAVAIGGPGALVWMWIATILGMAIVFAEASLSARARDDHDAATVHLLATPTLGRLLAPMYAVAVLVMAVVVGGAFGAQQTAAMLGSTHELPAVAVTLGLAVVAAPFVLLPTLRRLLLLLVPVALVLYAGLAGWVLSQGEVPLGLLLGDAFNHAFGVGEVPLGGTLGGVAGGGVALALTHGVLRATLAGQAGLGTAALLDLRARSRGAAGAVAMLVPLLAAGGLGSASALLMLGAPPTDAPVLDPAVAKAVPLEVTYSAGLRPSQQVGQTVVLPEDTTMEAGKHYAMRLRSDPRGHALAKLVEDQNHVALPLWAVAHSSDTVVFRSLGKERRDHAAWDIRIPCEREVKTTEGGLEYVLLRPKDPTIDLKAMATKLELLSQPYVVFDDFSFIGRVGRATSPDLGEHLAMYEAPNEERAFNPKLHEFFRTGYRGPYADDDGPRPPSGFVAHEGYAPDIGTKVQLRIVGNPRGDAAVLHTTRSGTLEAPAWDLLLDAKTVVLRHQSDASKDLRVPVTPRYELYRVRFDIADERFVNERGGLKTFEGYETEPYLVVPEYTFEAEVHGDTRLPEELKGRRTLVPLHPLGEVQGHFGDGETYRPHPAELLALGLQGPLLPEHEGAELAAARLLPPLGASGRLLLALAVVVLALSTLVAWTELASRAGTAVAGSVGAPALKVAMLVAAALGSMWTLPQLLPLVDLSLAAVLVPNLIGLVLLVPKIRQAARLRDDIEPAQTSTKRDA